MSFASFIVGQNDTATVYGCDIIINNYLFDGEYMDAIYTYIERHGRDEWFRNLGIEDIAYDLMMSGF